MTLSRSTPLRADRSHDWEEESRSQGWIRYRCTRCEEACNRRVPKGPPDWQNCPGMKRGSLERGSGPKPVSDRKDEKRSDLGTPLQEYVERLPCLLSEKHRCRGDVVSHHVRHKNHAGDWTERGGEKVGNLVPLCATGGHQGGPESVHVLGRDTFEERWGVDLAAEARRVGEAYLS